MESDSESDEREASVDYSLLSENEQVALLKERAIEIKKLKQRIRSLKSYRKKKLNMLFAKQQSLKQR